ncbi:MAG: FAD-dependent oxidoreductase [Hyphomicrobiaceae bacterium]|nr:FAD-dependent oxidoreductase [Hyphomicrobiaceae bacterium]
MSDVTPKYKGSVLRPLKALANLWREPATLPMEPRPAAPNYRGFHLNDWKLCIGCGTCQEICDNAAIRMVQIPDLPTDAKAGVKPRRPAIDYGRCCWCALCVDICPTGSLSLSREYIHVSSDIDSYFILPDEKGIHGLGFEKGWSKSETSDLLDHQRQEMECLPAEEALSGFGELVPGYDTQAAVLEASRCIQCGMCHEACPTGMNAPEYIRALWQGDREKAVAEIYRTNPLAQVCGRICTHACETACSVGRRGAPVAIRWLKRHAMDSVPPDQIREIAIAGKAEEPSGRRVSIIGAGPAGLTAAFDLAKKGHAVTIYEARSKPGGMMRFGIPEYRLPYHNLDADIDVIRASGVEILCNTAIGRDVSMAQIRGASDAVLISTGLWAARSARVPGTDHPRVLSAIRVLEAITQGEDFGVPRRAVVVGGGNVAFDVARSVARLQKARYGEVAMDVIALEDRDHMLADEEEVREAAGEGIDLFNSWGPKSIQINDGSIVALETVRCISLKDAEGRFHPKYDESTMVSHAADTVIEAIGQSADTSYLGKELVEALEWSRGRLKIDRAGRTSEPWLWAAGDMVEGPDVVHAIAAGHRAAASIDEVLAHMAVKPGNVA